MGFILVLVGIVIFIILFLICIPIRILVRPTQDEKELFSATRVICAIIFGVGIVLALIGIISRIW